MFSKIKMSVVRLVYIDIDCNYSPLRFLGFILMLVIHIILEESPIYLNVKGLYAILSRPVLWLKVKKCVSTGALYLRLYIDRIYSPLPNCTWDGIGIVRKRGDG